MIEREDADPPLCALLPRPRATLATTANKISSQVTSVKMSPPALNLSTTIGFEPEYLRLNRMEYFKVLPVYLHPLMFAMTIAKWIAMGFALAFTIVNICTK
jgi:hypothetical protein